MVMTNNSWQPYVDSNLVGTGKLSEALIASNSDGTIWAGSSSLLSSVNSTELKNIIGGFSDAASIRSEGMMLGGKKYILISQGEGRSLYGRKGDDGIIAVKTKQTVLIGLYSSGMPAGEAVKTVESLADYLISVNF
jgi:profilin